MATKFQIFLSEAAINVKQDTAHEWQMRADLSHRALFDFTGILEAFLDRGNIPFIEKLKNLQEKRIQLEKRFRNIDGRQGPEDAPSEMTGVDIDAMFPAHVDIAREILSEEYTPPHDLILLQHHLECVSLFFSFGPMFLPKATLKKLFLKFDYALLRLIEQQAVSFVMIYQRGERQKTSDSTNKKRRADKEKRAFNCRELLKKLTQEKRIQPEDGPYTIAKKVREAYIAKYHREVSIDTIRRDLKKTK